MSAQRAFQYWQSMTPIEANEMINQMQVAKYPHMDKQGRRKLENMLFKQAESHGLTKKKPLTTKEIVERLTKAQNG